ncbi:hypothetical protein COR50_14860 [Chitinophaga caeni]|uniref:Uncharacterized protein n=1 Tax=Chitinophaga caeni TaxID=2029983 RepID=A0A291QWP8_9BACT|nr:hypothetical protein [Chitinophaga caeni]ATL48341.1 hypothetical protein COR50_14860 [Chitinophaga caeni]
MYYIFIQAVDLFDELSNLLGAKFQHQTEPLTEFLRNEKKYAESLGGEYQQVDLSDISMCLVKNKESMLQPKYAAYPFYLLVKCEPGISIAKEMELIKYMLSILKEAGWKPVLTTELGL